MNEVQAMILNLSFPQSLEELKEMVLANEELTIETLLSYDKKEAVDTWTMPNWIKPDDIVFFMYTKKSTHIITRLNNQLQHEINTYIDVYEGIMNLLKRGKSLYGQYGGKIFMVGRVCNTPFYLDHDDLVYSPHWNSRRYAEVEGYTLLQSPIDQVEIKPFISLSCGGSITPVYGKEFAQLKDLISSRNTIPTYLDESVAMPIPLSQINSENWLEIASDYRRRFIYESQFRSFYVDYLLKLLGDRKAIYRECACKKEGMRTSFVDNVILFNEKYLPVEIKLSVSVVNGIEAQLQKYCSLDELFLDKKENRLAPKDKVYHDIVLVIDTLRVYLYVYKSNSLTKVFELDDLTCREDIRWLRRVLNTALELVEKLS